MKNPFTAPDIVDVLQEKRLSLRNAGILALTGVLLVVALLGGYRLGAWLLEKVTIPAEESVPMTDAVSTDEHTTDTRLQELLVETTEEVNVAEVSRRAEELGASAASGSTDPDSQALMEERKNELDR